MAEYQARKFSRIPGCTVTGCIDHHREHGEIFARRMGIPCCYASVEEMLDAGECSALSCVVADSCHYECCAAAGAAGDLGSHLADALLFLFGGLSVDAVGGVRLKEAMETGRLREEKLEAEFAGGGAWVEIAARGNLPGIDGAVPAYIRASWIIPEALDDFCITVEGTRARAVLDFRKSREGIELFEPAAGEGPASYKNKRFLAGMPAASSYELFIEAVERHIAGDRRPVNPAAGNFSFEQGLRVQRILDKLVPGGLPR
jgi:predicted dehydrogenase